MSKIFDHSVKTDVGLVRQANEDAAGYAPSEEVCNNGDLFVVCDGMGGHVGGAIASNTAVQSIIDFFKTGLHEDPYQAIRQAIIFANEQIYGRTEAEPELKGMGTTATVLLVRDGEAYIGHVGDSRIYMQSDGDLYRITRDHSFVQSLVDQGLLSDHEAELHPRKNELLKAMGIKPSVEPEVAQTPIRAKKGDRFLMCSDGLCGLVVDPTMNDVLSSERSLDDKADKLISLAKDAGGHDNITVALVEMTNSPFTESVFVDLNPVERLDTTSDMDALEDTQAMGTADFVPTPIWKQTRFQVIGGVVILVVLLMVFANPFGNGGPAPDPNGDSTQTALTFADTCDNQDYLFEVPADTTQPGRTPEGAVNQVKRLAGKNYNEKCLKFKGKIGEKKGLEVTNFTPEEATKLQAGDSFWLDCKCLIKSQEIEAADTTSQETDTTQVDP